MPLRASQNDRLLPSPSLEDQKVLDSSNEIAKHISAVEWLGPLAPIALSPFFGLACLSGIATYGPEWLQQRSGIFDASSPLNNPALFWTMVVLTMVSSLPRLSKVSKPLALAAEKLEAYSVVIIVIAMRVLASAESDIAESAASFVPIYLSSGIASIPLDIAMAIASAINIVVINGVKLFCELVIWLTPIPMIDATVEVTNKGLCIGLIGLYCWSPLVATLLNLVLLSICLVVYFWTQRRIVYYVELVVGPMIERWLPWWFAETADGETVFIAESWNGLPKLTKLRFKGSPNEGWQLTRRRWWRCSTFSFPPSQPRTKSGLLAQSVFLSGGHLPTVELHHRRSGRERVVELAIA
ncbi:MAG: hypothetical protein SGI77_08365 [Pirellulaceae bacterium]|nr:hypothetical protein [Pirellulaceae bacterium]